MEKKQNILFICSDQHSIFQTGCYGNDAVMTPNLDALARTGTRFEQAYSNNPICVPARACMATGRYTHELGTHDNAMPYIGQARSFGHRLEENGIPVTTIGKLHYRNTADDTGFKDQRIPLHIKGGIGDIFGLLRDGKSTKKKMSENLLKAGCRYGEYQDYDRAITQEAIHYLEEKKDKEGSWCCYVGYTFPHPPFHAPRTTWDMYLDKTLPMPLQYHEEEIPDHEAYKIFRAYYGYDNCMTDEQIQTAVKAYYSMCTWLDAQIGQLLDKLDALGMRENTVILYTSDHGEMLGNHGMWGKNCLYEQAARIPLIFNGPDVLRGKVNKSLCSLVDLYPTLLELAGVELSEEERTGFPGKSLVPMLQEDLYEERAVFSEFHATGSITGEFMIRYQDYKYIYFVGMRPQLFDLKKDPYELTDVSRQPEYAEIREMMDQKLHEVVDPEAVDRQVKADQENVLNQHGGREYVSTSWKPIIYSPAPKV